MVQQNAVRAILVTICPGQFVIRTLVRVPMVVERQEPVVRLMDQQNAVHAILVIICPGQFVFKILVHVLMAAVKLITLRNAVHVTADII